MFLEKDFKWVINIENWIKKNRLKNEIDSHVYEKCVFKQFFFFK